MEAIRSSAPRNGQSLFPEVEPKFWSGFGQKNGGLQRSLCSSRQSNEREIGPEPLGGRERD